MTTTQLNRAELLDTLTMSVTAFSTWGEFKQAMEGGYVPTLRSRTLTNASRTRRVYEKAVTMLRIMVREEGFKVFDGFNVS